MKQTLSTFRAKAKLANNLTFAMSFELRAFLCVSPLYQPTNFATSEAAVTAAARQKIGKSKELSDITSADIINNHVERVVVTAQTIQIQLKVTKAGRGAAVAIPLSNINGRISALPAVKANSGSTNEPFRPEIVQQLVRAHIWFRDLSEGRFQSTC